jgi:hypothetical protein
VVALSSSSGAVVAPAGNTAVAADTAGHWSGNSRSRRAAAAGVANLIQAEKLNSSMLAMQVAVDGSWRQNARPPAQASAMPVAQTEVRESLVQAKVGDA